MAVGTKADAKPEELRGTLPAGTRLRNYELISVLGHGGFGITYYARDTTLGREVAVKEYLPTSLALRENGTTVVPRSTQLAEDFIWGRERFLEEARILATLEGVPSIVRVYDYLEANGTAYMVMGLARGETLDQRLKRDKQLAPAIIERMLERLLGGLEEVHKAGFLHRDVKPANIILDAKDNPTLIDFGASRAAMADRTAAMTAIFTPRYAAAEQLTSDKQGPWTDIYSISATLYHSITGRPPPSSLERALNDTYEPLAGLSLAGFSSGTLQGIDAGLALRAKDRPQSIAVWRDVLSSTEASDGDATVVKRVKPSPAPKPPGPAPRTAAPPTPPSAPSEPSRLAVAAGSAGTSLVSALGVAIAGKNRIKLYAGVMAAILVLAAGGYLVFATKPAPSPAPFEDQTADGRDEAAKAQAERQRADEQAAKQKAEAEAQQKAAAEAQQKAAAEAQQKAAAEVQQKAAAEAQQKAAAEAQQKAAAEAQQKAAAEAQQKAAAEAQQKAAAEAQQKAATEAQQKAATEAQQKAGAEAQQKAAAEAQKKADAAAQQKAAAEAQQKAAAEAQQKAAAEAQQKAAAEAQQKADAAAQQKAAAEAQQKAAAEAQQKAAADAAAQKSAEATETALHLAPADRQRIQVALTSLGFDTHGADGVFGPRSREMITDWQRARNQPATGFLIAAQQQALLSEAAPALAKYDDEQKKAEEARRKEEAAARARAAASPSPAAPNPSSYPRNASGGGLSCQDTSGRRIEFPGATSCPYGLTPAR